MITPNNLVNLPPSIARLQLRLPDKIALHFIQLSPDVSNQRLAQLLGMRPRGAQDMLRRLRRLGYVTSHGKGRARQMSVLFCVEQHA